MPPKKKFLDKLSVGQKITIIVAILGGCCVVTAAIIGLGVPLISFFLDSSARQNALATPTFLPPTGAVELPANQLDILSVVISPPSASYYEGIITQDVDPSTNQAITITKNDVILVGKVSPKIESILNFDILLTGKASDEEVQVSNKIPIKVRFEPIPKKINLFYQGESGGGSYVSMLNATIDSSSNEVWAEYSPDIQEQFKQYQLSQELWGEWEYKIPSELEEVLSANEQNLPDFYLVKKNEKIAIPVVLFFNEPGIYYLQIGVEYIYRQYKDISWAESVIQVYAPNEASVWRCDNPEWNLGSRSCTFDR